jgi:asparagine synthase (glutamine-hydrolysing)
MPALDLPAFAAHVERDFNLVDGVSVDGSVFDNGGNAAARDGLQRGSAITSSGSGGEVFRNFFHLRDRPLRLVDVVHAFYRQFDPSTAVRAFDLHGYDAAIAQKMAATLETDLDVVDRRLVEQLYPSFRCRANLGREISIVGRYGAYFVPFLEPAVVRDALEVPLSLKGNARFEASLISRLSPALARYPTVYGRNVFSPRLTVRFDEALTNMRPMWLRRLNTRLKSRTRPLRDGHGGVLDREHLGAVIDLGFPAMRTYFRPERFRDEGLLRRVALMEYLAKRLSPAAALEPRLQ